MSIDIHRSLLSVFMVDHIDEAGDVVEESGSHLPKKQPGNMSEAIEYANGGYDAALHSPDALNSRDALKALKFFAWVGIFAQNAVVGGKIRKTSHRHIGCWAGIVRRGFGIPPAAEYLGMTIAGFDQLEMTAASKRTDMSHTGGGGYRFLGDHVGKKPEAALGRVEATNRWGREIDSGDVRVSVADRVDDAFRGGLRRKPYER